MDDLGFREVLAAQVVPQVMVVAKLLEPLDGRFFEEVFVGIAEGRVVTNQR